MSYDIRMICYPDSPQIRVYTGDVDIKHDPYMPVPVRERDPFDGKPVVLYEDYLKNKERNKKSSLKRTKDKVYYYCRSNKWDWFVTLTFSPDSVDRYNYDKCSEKLMNWLSNVKRNSGCGFQYVIVPEKHKDGAFHFHGLFSGELPGMVYSGHCDKKSRPIYNINSYGLGFTTATKVGENSKAASYLMKYISKDMFAVSDGRKRYWVSRGLDKASIYVGQSLRCFNDGWRGIVEWLKQIATYAKFVSGDFFDTWYFEFDSNFYDTYDLSSLLYKQLM